MGTVHSEAESGSEGRIRRLQADRRGADRYQKVSYPIRYGRYTRLETSSFIFDYTLNGEIRFIQGRDRDWPHPQEWLKRTVGNDWIYYYAGGYADIVDSFGEYYLPCPEYGTNSLWHRNPFADPGVRRALTAWENIPEALRRDFEPRSHQERQAVEAICAQDRQTLRSRALRLQAILQGRVSVLPPDARHADYDCLPLMVADGCLYNCGFCTVKTGQPFVRRSRKNILEQLKSLHRFFGPEITNYSTLFLGQHDALQCGRELIEFAAEKGYDLLDFKGSFMRDHRLLLFGSVDSLLSAPEALFASLEAMPFETCINIGFESADQATLDSLRKPIHARQVKEAFFRMLELNRRYRSLEITANFILNTNLPQEHFARISELTGQSLSRPAPKGTIYLSPMHGLDKLEHLRIFKELKQRSRLPMYIYLIQRL